MFIFLIVYFNDFELAPLLSIYPPIYFIYMGKLQGHNPLQQAINQIDTALNCISISLQHPKRVVRSNLTIELKIPGVL